VEERIAQHSGFPQYALEEPIQSSFTPQFDQLVDTLRAVTEEDVTQPLLPSMQTLIGKLDRRCSDVYGLRPATSAQLGDRHPERTMWNAS
jgi:hypothetical protein